MAINMGGVERWSRKTETHEWKLPTRGACETCASKQPGMWAMVKRPALLEVGKDGCLTS